MLSELASSASNNYKFESCMEMRYGASTMLPMTQLVGASFATPTETETLVVRLDGC